MKDIKTTTKKAYTKIDVNYLSDGVGFTNVYTYVKTIPSYVF